MSSTGMQSLEALTAGNLTLRDNNVLRAAQVVAADSETKPHEV
jgi:hypothetical protein